MAGEHILGLKNKKLALGYSIPTYSDYKKTLTSRSKVKRGLQDALENLKRYDLENEEKVQKLMISDGHKFGVYYSKAIFNTLLMAKNELEICEKIGEGILKGEKMFKEAHSDVEFHRLKDLAKNILAKQGHELATLRKLLSEIFGLEQATKGAFNAKLMFKSPPPDMVEKFVVRRDIRDMVREERKIEQVFEIVEKALNAFGSKSAAVNKQIPVLKKKFFDALENLPDLIEKDIKNLLYIAEHIFVHVKEVIDPFLTIIAVNDKAIAKHIIPKNMGEGLSVEERKNLNEIYGLLKNEQLMLNQLIAKEKETEAALAEAT